MTTPDFITTLLWCFGLPVAFLAACCLVAVMFGEEL